MERRKWFLLLNEKFSGQIPKDLETTFKNLETNLGREIDDDQVIYAILAVYQTLVQR